MREYQFGTVTVHEFRITGGIPLFEVELAPGIFMFAETEAEAFAWATEIDFERTRTAIGGIFA